jgi:hypothetical protein
MSGKEEPNVLQYVRMQVHSDAKAIMEKISGYLKPEVNQADLEREIFDYLWTEVPQIHFFNDALNRVDTPQRG